MNGFYPLTIFIKCSDAVPPSQKVAGGDYKINYLLNLDLVPLMP